MGVMIWLGISIALAVVGSIVLYFTFLRKSNDQKFKGFLGWMYDFLSFKHLTIEVILKVSYLIGAIFITLVSFAFIGSSALAFFGMLIFGNLVLRIAYEGALLVILIYKNVKELNEKK